jgi:hypothetical protein
MGRTVVYHRFIHVYPPDAMLKNLEKPSRHCVVAEIDTEQVRFGDFVRLETSNLDICG